MTTAAECTEKDCKIFLHFAHSLASFFSHALGPSPVVPGPDVISTKTKLGQPIKYNALELANPTIWGIVVFMWMWHAVIKSN